jgi:hypothetical protein
MNQGVATSAAAEKPKIVVFQRSRWLTIGKILPIGG